MSEIKTLKEIPGETFQSCRCGDYDEGCLGCYEKRLKAEAVKWIKEDKRRIEQGTMTQEILLRRWVRRLNITEEDLLW